MGGEHSVVELEGEVLGGGGCWGVLAEGGGREGREGGREGGERAFIRGQQERITLLVYRHVHERTRQEKCAKFNILARHLGPAYRQLCVWIHE